MAKKTKGKKITTKKATGKKKKSKQANKKQKPRLPRKLTPAKMPQIKVPTSPPYGYNIFDVEKIITEICKELNLDTIKLDKTVKEVKKQEICYFPIRHHSISSSYAVLRALYETQPKLVFLEAPSDCEDLIPYLVEKNSVPPIAIVSFFKDAQNQLGLNGVKTQDPQIPAKFVAWYPFLQYSPEYLTMLYCTINKVPLHFIDAPYIHTTADAVKIMNIQPVAPQSISSTIQDDPEDISTVDGTNILHVVDDVFGASLFYQKFCERFQVDSLDDAWDMVFEIGAQFRDWEEYQHTMLSYCAAVRLSIPDYDENTRETEYREQYMRFRMRELFKKYPQVNKSEAMVITGGLHSVTLYNTQALKKTEIPPFSSENTLVPFSFHRLSSLSGYGAGNRYPAFYQAIWSNLTQKNSSEEPFAKTVLDFGMAIIHKARKKGELLSSSDSIAVIQSAQMLAALRYRPEPSVTDLIDSLVLCCVKGDPNEGNIWFRKIIENTVVGRKLGKITELYTQSGLILDFHSRLDSFGIELDDQVQTFEIDLREDEEVALSKFFWQLESMGIDVVELIQGPKRNSIDVEVYHEIWKLRWNPEINIRLGELGVSGTTVEEVALNLLKEKMIKHQGDSNECAFSLVQGIRMGLISQFSNLKQIFINSLDLDKDFFRLAESFEYLFLLRKILQSQQSSLLADAGFLISKNYFNLCSFISNLANPPPEKEELVVVQLRSIIQLIISDFKVGLNQLVLDGAMESAYLSSQNPRVSGAFIGGRYLLNQVQPDEIQAEISAMTKNVMKIQMQVGSFIRGLVEMCRAKIMFEPKFLSILLKVVENLEWNLFMIILPGLKSAFMDLEPRDYDMILEQIAAFYGLTELEMADIIGPTESIKSILTVWDSETIQIVNEWLD